MVYTSTLLNPKDNAATQINNAAGYAAGVGSIVVDDGTVFPTAPYAVALGADTINYEEIVVASRSGNTLTFLTNTVNVHADNEWVEVTVGAEYLTRLNGFATGHTHTGTTDGTKLPVPFCRAYHSVDQSIATGGGLTALALNSERWDTDGIHDTATNNSRLTCQTAGTYVITGNVRFASNATGYRLVGIRQDAGSLYGTQLFAALSGGDTIVSVATELRLTATQYVELCVAQTSGGALNVNGASTSNDSCEFSMALVERT